MPFRRKNSILVCYELDRGGETRATQALLSELRKQPGAAFSEHTVEPLRSSGLVAYARWFGESIFQLYSLFKSKKDPVHVYTAIPTAALAAALLVWQKKVPVVFHYHGSRLPLSLAKVPFRYRFSQFLKYYGMYWVEYCAFSTAETVVFPSEEALQKVALSYPILQQKNTQILPNGFDPALCRPVTKLERQQLCKVMGLPKKELVFVYSGRVQAEKNILLLLRWLTSIKKRHSVTLIIAFPAPQTADERQYLSTVTSFVHKNNLQKNVHFLKDAFSHYKPYEVYGVADYCISFSKTEVMPLFALEATACQIPVLTPYLSRNSYKTETWSTRATQLSSILKQSLFLK